MLGKRETGRAQERKEHEVVDSDSRIVIRGEVEGMGRIGKDWKGMGRIGEEVAVWRWLLMSRHRYQHAR